jgi:hypothetical protein
MFITELFENLTESPTDILYHVSSVVNISKILKDKRLFFTSSLGNDIERRYQKTGYDYYFSTARSKTSEYIMKNYDHRSGVMKLNGRWFSSKFPTKPIDYFDGWWIKIRKMSPNDEFASRETEDRIMAKKPFVDIKNLNEVIQELHFFFKEGFAMELFPYYVSIIKNAKINNIPIYFYDDKNAALIQNKSKAMPIKDVISILKTNKDSKNRMSTKYSSYMYSRDYTKPWRELYYKNDYEKLSKEAKRIAYNLYRSSGFGASEITRSLESDIHNDRKYPERASKIKYISDILRKEKLKNIPDFVKFISEKWEKIMDKNK